MFGNRYNSNRRAHEQHQQQQDELGGDGDEEDDDIEMEQFTPDWQLIDEISIKLLENGVGTFETLQRALPSVLLAQIDHIVSDDDAPPPTEGIGHCTGAHLLKLFRLAQLQIDYLLNTQQSLVERLERTEQRARRFHKENRIFRDEFFEQDDNVGERKRHIKAGGDVTAAKVGRKGAAGAAQWGKELFRCNECSKVFLHANFLADHILRKHHSAETGGGSMGGSLRRLVGGGGGGGGGAAIIPNASTSSTKGDDGWAVGEVPNARAGAGTTTSNMAKKLIRRGHSQQEPTKKRYSKKFGLSKHNTSAAGDFHKFSSSIGEETVDEHRQQKLSSESSSNAWR